MRIAGEIGQQVAQYAVYYPRRDVVSSWLWKLRQRDLHFVKLRVARFVDTRMLRGRADEQARKQVRQRRVILPITNEAAEQVGPAQEGRIVGHPAADDDVVAAAGADA